MKKRYIGILLILGFIIKNSVEYAYEGNQEDAFFDKWVSVINKSNQKIDNSVESSLAGITEGNKNMSTPNLRTYGNEPSNVIAYGRIMQSKGGGGNSSYGSNSPSYELPSIPLSGTGNALANSGGNRGDGLIAYNNKGGSGGDMSYSGSSGSMAGRGPSYQGMGDMAMASPETNIGSGDGGGGGNVWGGNEVGVLGNPGGITDVPPDTPIDGGLSLLFAAAIGRGIQSYRNKKQLKKVRS